MQPESGQPDQRANLRWKDVEVAPVDIKLLEVDEQADLDRQRFEAVSVQREAREAAELADARAELGQEVLVKGELGQLWKVSNAIWHAGELEAMQRQSGFTRSLGLFNSLLGFVLAVDAN